MLTRLQNALKRLDIFSAYEHSRQIAGATGGSFFTLGGICKVPLQQFLRGYGAAGITFTASLVSMGYNLFENFRASDADHPARVINADKLRFSTELIMRHLHQDHAKTLDFLRTHQISEVNITRFEQWDNDHDINIQDIFNSLYTELHFDITKYPVSLIYALLNTAAHFIECLLIQVYVDKNIFDYGDHPTPANVLLSLLMLTALCSGLMTFFKTKHSYENPPAEKLCHVLFKAYEAHAVTREAQNDQNMHLENQQAYV